MRQLRIVRLLLVTLLCGSSFTARGTGTDRREILRAAQQSYYNLPSQGFIEFQCSAIPNWTAILKEEMRSDRNRRERSNRNSQKQTSGFSSQATKELINLPPKEVKCECPRKLITKLWKDFNCLAV